MTTATITSLEAAALIKFRVAVEDLDLNGEERDPYFDAFLLRWLRARNLDIPKSKEMLKRSMEWRRKENVDSLVHWNPPTTFTEDFPYEIWGFDHHDCPTGYLPFGIWDVRNVVIEEEGRLMYVKYIDKLFEYVSHVLSKLSAAHNRPITQFNIVIDMEHLSLKQLTSIQTIDTILENVRRFEANHPETLKNAFVINAPKVFSVLFSIVRPFLTMRTLGKVSVFDSSRGKWEEAILAVMPHDQVPYRFGGSNNNVLYDFEKALKDLSDGTLKSSKSQPTSFEGCRCIEAGHRIHIPVPVKIPGTEIIWSFTTEDFDIHFGILKGDLEVLALERVDSHLNPVSGSLIADEFGQYNLVFDNKQSRMRSKTVSFSIAISAPII